MSDPALISDEIKIALAAAAGGCVRLLFRPGKTIGQTIWVMLACMTCGFYATPPTMAWLHLPPEFVGAVGAATGFVGLSVAEAVLQTVDSVDIKALLDRILRRWLP